MTIIRFRRGNKVDLPASAPEGMPLWCEDTKELFMGTGSNITPIINNSYDNVPYSVNRGRQNSDGYADFIEVGQDNESVIIKASEVPLKFTYPDGSQEEITEDITISGIFNDGTYRIVKEKGQNPIAVTSNITEENFYPSDFTGEQTENTIVPLLSSNSQDGYVVTASAVAGAYYPYYAFNGNTYAEGAPGPWISNQMANPPQWLQIKLPAPKAIWKYYIHTRRSGESWQPKSWKIQGSNDEVNWDDLDERVNVSMAGGSRYEFTLPEPSAEYLYLRISITSSNSASYGGIYYVAISGLNFYEYAISTVADGDYNLNFAVKPYNSAKKISGGWTPVQFVKFGQFTKISGMIGTPISYAFNGFTVINKKSVTKANKYILNHNIGTNLLDITGYYNNVQAGSFATGSNGYSIDITSNTTKYGSTVIVDKNDLTLKTSYYHIWYIDQSNVTEYITTADLQLFVRRTF